MCHSVKRGRVRRQTRERLDRRAQVPQDRQVIAHGPGAHFGDAPFLIGRNLLRRELTDWQPGPEGREQLFLQNPFVLVE